jgi:hypothetical protein
MLSDGPKTGKTAKDEEDMFEEDDDDDEEEDNSSITDLLDPVLSKQIALQYGQKKPVIP